MSAQRLPLVAICVAVACAAGGAAADPQRDTPAGAADPPATSADASSGWQFEVTPYLLITGLHGDLGVTQAIPPVHVALGPGDVFSSLRFGLMGALQARHDRFVAMSDLIYASNKFDKHIGIRDPDFLTASVTSKIFISTDMVGYRFYDPAEHGGVAIDALAGARFQNVDTGLKLEGPRRVFEGGRSQLWVDPLVGIRALGPIRGKLSWSAYGDVGGFGVGSKLTGEVFGSVQYALARRWKLVAGWRYLTSDYHHGGFVYDAALNGPLLGASYRF